MYANQTVRYNTAMQCLIHISIVCIILHQTDKQVCPWQPESQPVDGNQPQRRGSLLQPCVTREHLALPHACHVQVGLCQHVCVGGGK